MPQIGHLYEGVTFGVAFRIDDDASVTPLERGSNLDLQEHHCMCSTPLTLPSTKLGLCPQSHVAITVTAFHRAGTNERHDSVHHRHYV